MGTEGHQLEDGEGDSSEPAEDAGAPLDSGADGGAMDDAVLGRDTPGR